MKREAKITSKGQITVPLAIRQELGVQPGDTLLFESGEDGVRVRPKRARSPFAKYRGNRQSGDRLRQKGDWPLDERRCASEAHKLKESDRVVSRPSSSLFLKEESRTRAVIPSLLVRPKSFYSTGLYLPAQKSIRKPNSATRGEPNAKRPVPSPTRSADRV